MTEARPLDNLFLRYVSDFEHRKPLTAPHAENGFVYVTNGHIGFEIPADMLEGEYPTNPEYPDLKGKIDRRDDGTEYPVYLLRKALVTWGDKPVYREIECRECDGSGASLCTCCGHESECDACKGEGRTTTDVIIDHCLTAPIGDSVKILGSHFDPKYIYEMCRVADALGVGYITITQSAKYNPAFNSGTPMAFLIGSVRGVLMPLGIRDDEAGKMVEVKP